MTVLTCRTFYGKTIEVDPSELIFRLSAYGFITHEDQLLVMDLPVIGKLSLPGGGIEKGETSHQAVVREIQEETSLTVKVNELVAHTEDFFYYDPWKEAWQGLLLFYNCSIASGNPDALVHTNTGEDHEELPKWLATEDIDPKKFVPPVAQAFSVWKTKHAG